MKFSFRLLFLILLGCSACQSGSQRITRTERQILIIHPEGQSVSPEFAQMIEQAASAQNWAIHYESDWDIADEEFLLQHSAIILTGIAPQALPLHQTAAIERYVQSGGGIIWEAAGDHQLLPHQWPWAESAFAPQDPALAKQTVTAVKHLAEDTTPKKFDGGRIWMPHNWTDWSPESWTGAIGSAIGTNSYDLGLTTTRSAPKASRFTRKVLDDYDINEPMELAALPNGDVIFIERRGKMKLYKADSGNTKTIATFEVCTSGNYEDGMLGLELDPHYPTRPYLYLYYSPSEACDRPQTLSRFTMHGDSIILGSEKIILEVPVQRETCCHSGGEIVFGTDGYLYLSTGDNTSSKESDGYTPIDERPGRGPFDAQKSSGNTHDLRGKILRIKVNSFGSYDIPDGNLFPKDGSQGAPEIYVMGCRNPFRFSVDPKTHWVYWGDVGPDVGQAGKYGPQSYDEWNQAKSAGNFGWPYFVGNNFAYFDRDFDMDTVGAYFDPLAPKNQSPNNTGSIDLPPAQPAWIWYPYGMSPEFPLLGDGSRSAMAGPVFYQDQYDLASDTKFPQWFDGKIFIYEWARSWIKVVEMDSTGQVRRIEPFLPDMPLSKPIDLEFGPDGAMYLLEYGENYFMNNPQARLVKVEYAAGNRQPIAHLQAQPIEGAAPHTVQFDASTSFDYDLADSTLNFAWDFDGDGIEDATGAQASFTYTESGTFTATVTVTDPQTGAASASQLIRVGNAPPVISLELSGNQDFAFAGQRRNYAFKISDIEDEASGRFRLANAAITTVFVADGHDLEVTLGEGQAMPSASLQYAKGLNLIENSDCSSCHDMEIHSVGPSYQEVAAFYGQTSEEIEQLANKIITGGNGVWGEKIMAGHPQHTLDETREMAKYILSLDQASQTQPTGTIAIPADAAPQGAYLLAATYQDQGANGIAPISTRLIHILRSSKIEMESNAESSGLGFITMGAARDESAIGWFSSKDAFVKFDEMDLTGVGGANLRLAYGVGGKVHFRIDAVDGPEIGSLNLPAGEIETWRETTVSFSQVQGKHTLYVVFEPAAEGHIGRFDWMQLLPAQGI
ncbi:PQQ-dependent sugar dehydrogenase [Pontibacter sp. G13]|uniref:PQQ-dependent sugar dehydrogenase n=1 Tax=Pontibacter sp. G13 TaxID=3074898 RepID=UPI00288A4C9A|nr:PQQ-dependent sugar dehydrogenase [Pontibacter sp. G13]WNJ20139.1 PQQ-dependent sugar dehydrogenase [Pontibacter sp. G13]